MDRIKLNRNGVELTFTKVPDQFAVKLQRGRASDEKMLESCLGKAHANVRHLEPINAAKMDLFDIESDKMEDRVNEMRARPASEIVTHVYSLDDTPEGRVIPNGKMTIRFHSNVDKARKESIFRDLQLEIQGDFDFLPDSHIVRLTQGSPMNPLKLAVQLQAMKEIQTADPHLCFQIKPAYRPSDSKYPEQWHLNNPGVITGLKAGADVKAEAAWDISKGKREVTICVMDDGFDLEHPDFGGAGKIVHPMNFDGQEDDPSPVASDDNHGTACAGVALAGETGSGIVGLAPECAFMPIRTSRWLTDDSLYALFAYAIAHEADVISCSWSAAAKSFALGDLVSEIIKVAATEGRRNKKGCVICFAAGNENRLLNDAANGIHQGFALHPHVIAVSATNSLDFRSKYSNFGPEIAVCAPSSGSPGRGVVTTDRMGSLGYSSGNFADEFGGTSSATPLVAGLAGLVLSVNPDLTAAQVKALIRETADKIVDPEFGQYGGDGHSKYFGSGRINAHKALLKASGGSSPIEKNELYMEHRINRKIEDQTTIEDVIPFPLNKTVSEIRISLHLTHPYRGDLVVKVKSPLGADILLHNRSGGGEDNLISTFSSITHPNLFTKIVGSPAMGQWRISVSDEAKGDAGLLEKWGIAIKY